MAATRSFVRSAVAAAVIVLLSACGGGEIPEQAQIQASPEVIKALSGPAVPADREGILAVSAPASQVQPKFSLTAETKVMGTGTTREQKLESVAEVSPVDKLFDWAEGAFPELFPGHKTSVKLVAGVEYTLRYYPETKNYVGVTPDGGIYGLGPYTGNVLALLGHICDVPVTGDSCRPKVLSTSPANGAIDVSAKGTSVDYVFGNTSGYVGGDINCAGVSGTSEVGTTDVKVIVTVTCRSSNRTVTIAPQDGRWPFGVEACLTLGGIQNLAGYGSLPVTTCFTTKPVQLTPAFYIGDLALADGSNAVHVMNPIGEITKEIGFPVVPGFGQIPRMVADPLSGHMVVVPWLTKQVYLVDLEDHQVATIDLSPALDTYFLLEGAFINGANFCTALTKSFSSNVWTPMNQLACWNRTTKTQSITAKQFLAGETMRTLRIDLVGDKVYLLNGLETAYDNSDFLWLPGTPGELRVLNPVTLALERTIKVGSVPVDFAVHPTSGDVWVINGGDKSLSVVHPNGNVETTPMSGLSESPYQRPTNIALDVENGQVYITDGYRNLVVYDMTTRREVRRISLGTVGSSPRTMLLRGNDLYVVLSNRGTIVKVDVKTFGTTTFTTSLGGFPGSLYGVGL